MNTAQKVRLWFMLGISVIMGIALIVLGALPRYELAMGQGDGAYFWIVLTFGANLVLGSICLYRFMHPVVRLAPVQPMQYQRPYGQPYDRSGVGYPPAPAQYPYPVRDDQTVPADWYRH